MGRQSTIKQLPDSVRDEVDRMVRDDGWTIDEITERIEELGGDASRSAVGRYVKSAREQMETYRKAQEIAKTWARSFEEDPNSDVGQLLTQMLQTVSFKTLSELGDTEDGATVKEVQMLARAIKDMSSAQKLSLDRELRIRQEMAKKAAQEADSVAEELGLNAQQTEQMRERILGIVA